LSELVQLEPSLEHNRNLLETFKKKAIEEGSIISEIENYYDYPEIKDDLERGYGYYNGLTYEDICSGNKHYQKNSNKNQFNCRLVSDSPFYKLAPAKEEQLHADPNIYIYHDIITDKQAEVMKTITLTKVNLI
jgi:hypothetical protein